MKVKKNGKNHKRVDAVNGESVNPSVAFKNKCVSDTKTLSECVKHCKGLGLRIVLTQGSWDLVHIGHARYFKEAKKHGDILIVGVDNDEKVRARKGPERPVVPETERIEMVTHLRYVDLATIKKLTDPKWHLIKTVKPDVLIATQETYSKKEIKELQKYCGKVVILKPQATTSTSAKIRRLQIVTAKKLEKSLTPKLLATIKEVLNGI